MEKEKFLSKFNITDYNNELEDILEKKSFSEGTKNILLNILYKMETSYEDYNKVKKETGTKKDILEEVLQIVRKKCKEIEIVKPKIDKKTKLEDKKFILEKDKIIVYPNEKDMYFALLNLQDNKYKIEKEYSIFQKPIENLLNTGYVMDMEENIRDFDGWAWNISKDDIENFTYNLVYQNLKFIVGEEFLKDSILNINKINFLERLEKKIDIICNYEEIANEIIEEIYLISLLEYIESNPQEKEKIEKEKTTLEKAFNKINNKKEYLQEIANKKKLIAKQIKGIDGILGSNLETKKQFKTVNSKRAENEKIPTVDEYVRKLKEKRKVLLRNLKQYASLMKPMNYVKNKYRIKRLYDLTEKIDFNEKTKKQKELLIEELQINFLKVLQKKIGKVEIRKKVVDYIYILRYYKMLYFNNKKQIKDISKIKEQLEITEKYLITRVCNLKLVNIFSNNIERNYEIISKIIDSNIIDLDELNVEFKKKDGKILLNIYDDNMIDKTIEYSETEDINAKYGKKIKLLI